MPRIQPLAAAVINKIAAGEVIERPASVVKELLENSVDAGATHLDIEIEMGGTELIRIVDNGHGIHADDLPLAFTNHATSKLSTAEDLFAVGTMGFRGEALASIGGVAQVTLQSRPPDAAVGAQIACFGGELSPVRAWNGAAGTRIEVRHLFYNTPVRRKFLRTPATEVGHICEIFTRLALSRPHLHLNLRHHNKPVYEVSAGTSLLDRIRLFYGAEIADSLYILDARQGPVHLYGYIADPACNKGTAKMQYLFLNGRWIRDRALGHALQEAYRGLLMTGRYAVAFLFLELPPDHVDVNVHPTKSEVRFRDASAMFRFVLESVQQRLRQENLVARLQAPLETASYFEPRAIEAAGSLYAAAPAGTPAAPVPAGPPEPPLFAGLSHDESPAMPAAAREIPTPAAQLPQPQVQPRPAVKAMQVHNTYLVLETEDGMLVIDQHALHERILYEQIKQRVRSGSLEVQQMLLPEPLDLPAEQSARLLEQRGELATLGLGIEDFGGGTILVTRYPALLGRRAPTEVVRRVADHLTAKDRLPTREQLMSDLMSLMACHAAVRSGDPLSPEEIHALAEMRHLAVDAHHCPHGRPTALLFTRQELDRQFRRV